MMVDLKDIPDNLIDALLATYEKPDDFLGKDGIIEQLTKRVVERVLQAEMTHHPSFFLLIAAGDGGGANSTVNVEEPKYSGACSDEYFTTAGQLMGAGAVSCGWPGRTVDGVQHYNGIDKMVRLQKK